MIHKTAALLGASLLVLASPALAEAHDYDDGVELLLDSTDAAAPASALPTIDYGTWGFQPPGLATDIKPGDALPAARGARAYLVRLQAGPPR
jgi:putative endopeptidase